MPNQLTHPSNQGDAVAAPPPQLGRRFIIIGAQRSGTTVTHSCIKDHPQATCPSDEVMIDPLFARGISAFTGGGETYEERASAMSGLFDLLARALAPTAKKKAWGFKVAVSTEVQACDLCNALREFLPDVHVILVRRHQVIAQCGSLYLASQTGQWHAWAGGTDKRGSPTIEIPLDYFDDYVREARAIDQQLETLTQSHRTLHLDYEQDIVTGLGWPRMFHFLGLDAIPVTWLRMEKVAPPPEEFISNYALLQNRLLTLPKASLQVALANAARRSLELTAAEHPNFLFHRATQRLTQPDSCIGGIKLSVSELAAAALADIDSAFLSQRPYRLDATTAGCVAAALECIADRWGMLTGNNRLVALTNEFGKSAHFLAARAYANFKLGRHSAACAEAIRLLGLGANLPEELANGAFALLQTIAVDSPSSVPSTLIADLPPRWANTPMHLSLQARQALDAGAPERARQLALLGIGLSPDASSTVAGECSTILQEAWVDSTCQMTAVRDDLALLPASFRASPQGSLLRAHLALLEGANLDAEELLLATLQRGSSPWIEGRAFGLLGKIWDSSEQWENHLDALARLPEEYLHSPYFRLRRGWMLAQHGSWQEACNDAGAALGLIRGDRGLQKWAFHLVEVALTATTDASAVRMTLQRLRPHGADNADFHVAESILLQHLGNPAAAAISLERALQLEPDHSRALALFAKTGMTGGTTADR